MSDEEFEKYTPFVDIGYKYPTLPEVLSVGEYYHLMVESFLRYDEETTDNAFRQFRYHDNYNARSAIAGSLYNIPIDDWNDTDRRLYRYMLSDIDFYSSKEQFIEIFAQYRGNEQRYSDAMGVPYYYCIFSLFTDIGYKNFAMPEGLSMDEYLDIIHKHMRGETLWERNYEEEIEHSVRGGELLLRLASNMCTREEIILHLKSVPEEDWTDDDRWILGVVISDVDIDASRKFLPKIIDYTKKLK